MPTALRGHGAAQPARGASFDTVQRALTAGTVIASFTIESFSLDRLAALTPAELAMRRDEFARVVRVS